MKSRNFLQEIRVAKGFSQEEVAKKLNVSVNTVQNWERDLKFKSPESLHALLDLYGVSDVTRNNIVINVYGRKSEGNVVMTEQISKGMNLKKEAIEKLEGEKDIQYFPYQLDKLCTCLDVIDCRIQCVETAIRYVEDFYFNKTGIEIFEWETARLIDAVGREYGVETGAVGVYQIQENNRKVNEMFPFGYEEGCTVYSDEFGQEMDYEEYINELNTKVDWNRSSLAEQGKALGEMRKDILELSVVRERILTYICQQGSWENMVNISGLLEVETGMFWEVITIQRTGKYYKRTSSRQRMKWFLNPKRENMINIDRRPKVMKQSLMKIYCDATYYEKETVAQALHVMGRALDAMPSDVDVLDVKEWEDVCRKSTVLRDLLIRYK